jgi:hypothetical protein
MIMDVPCHAAPSLMAQLRAWGLERGFLASDCEHRTILCGVSQCINDSAATNESDAQNVLTSLLPTVCDIGLLRRHDAPGVGPWGGWCVAEDLDEAAQVRKLAKFFFPVYLGLYI